MKILQKNDTVKNNSIKKLSVILPTIFLFFFGSMFLSANQPEYKLKIFKIPWSVIPDRGPLLLNQDWRSGMHYFNIIYDKPTNDIYVVCYILAQVKMVGNNPYGNDSMVADQLIIKLNYENNEINHKYSKYVADDDEPMFRDLSTTNIFRKNNDTLEYTYLSTVTGRAGTGTSLYLFTFPKKLLLDLESNVLIDFPLDTISKGPTPYWVGGRGNVPSMCLDKDNNYAVFYRGTYSFRDTWPVTNVKDGKVYVTTYDKDAKFVDFKAVFNADSNDFPTIENFTAIVSYTPDKVINTENNGYVFADEMYYMYSYAHQAWKVSYTDLIVRLDEDFNYQWNKLTKDLFPEFNGARIFRIVSKGDKLFFVARKGNAQDGFTAGKNNILVASVDLETGDLIAYKELSEEYSELDINGLLITNNGDILITGRYNDYSIINQSTIRNWYAAKLDQDFNLKWELAGPSYITNVTPASLYTALELEDGKYLLLGLTQPPKDLRYVTSEVLTILVDENSSIKEPSSITNLLISPNPTDASTTVSVDLETAGNLTVTLNNMLGQELLEIYNGFTVEGTFTKTFSLKELPIGVYYLKIVHNGNVKVEKVIRQ